MVKGCKAGAIFDGTGRPEEQDQILLFENDIIREIVPACMEEELSSRGVEILDYSDCFLMPGMIDAHVHLMLPGDGTPVERANYEMLCRFRDTIEEGYARTAKYLRYIPGTDAGWRGAGFDTLCVCMENMARLGGGNRSALRSATGLAAEVLGIADRFGTLAPGKQADFILLAESPAENMSNLSKIKAVFQRGNQI